jgi:hypothetical protein
MPIAALLLHCDDAVLSLFTLFSSITARHLHLQPILYVFQDIMTAGVYVHLPLAAVALLALCSLHIHTCDCVYSSRSCIQSSYAHIKRSAKLRSVCCCNAADTVLLLLHATVPASSTDEDCCSSVLPKAYCAEQLVSC